MKKRTKFLAALALAGTVAAWTAPGVHADIDVTGLSHTGANHVVAGDSGYTTTANAGNYVFTSDTYKGGNGTGAGGSGVVIKTGDSALFVSGTYTGGNGIVAGSGIVTSSALPVEIDGGTFTGGSGTLGASVSGTRGSVVDIYGGTFNPDPTDGRSFLATGSTFTLYGYDLIFTLGDGASGDNSGFGTITGRLADNKVDGTYNYLATTIGTINLVNLPVPEPGAYASLLVGVAGIGALALRRRKCMTAS